MKSWCRDLWEYYWLLRFPWSLLTQARRDYLCSRWASRHAPANRHLLNPLQRYAAYRRNVRAIQREVPHGTRYKL